MVLCGIMAHYIREWAKYKMLKEYHAFLSRTSTSILIMLLYNVMVLPRIARQYGHKWSLTIIFFFYPLKLHPALHYRINRLLGCQTHGLKFYTCHACISSKLLKPGIPIQYFWMLVTLSHSHFIYVTKRRHIDETITPQLALNMNFPSFIIITLGFVGLSIIKQTECNVLPYKHDKCKPNQRHQKV